MAKCGFSFGHKLEVPIGQSHGGSELQLGVGWHSGATKRNLASARKKTGTLSSCIHKNQLQRVQGLNIKHKTEFFRKV